jgi:lambda family phage minor tail protein L
LIEDVNKLHLDSDLIELFMVQTGESSYVYFTTYHQSVVFRDYESPYTERTYSSLPVDFTGFEQKSDGAYARPRVSFANILNTFETAIGSNEDLIGLKVVRRKTLQKYTGTGGSGAPTEFPKQVFIIDRIESSNASFVTFELATPFDLAGIKVPNRYIIPNTCPWRYQGSSTDFGVGVGGCNWNNDNNGFAAYFDRNNNLLIASTLVESTAHTGGSYTKDLVYKVANASGTRINVDGSTTTTTIYDLWQPYATGSGTLSKTVARRARQYTTYSGGTTYYAYKDGKNYSDAVIYDNSIWVVTQSHTTAQTPSNTSAYWERADVCGKKLTSCKARFQVKEAATNVPSTDEDSRKVLPYGGFPASRRYRA